MGTEKIKAAYDNLQTKDVLKKAKELGLDNDTLMNMYRTMIKIRLFEEKADQLYALGKVHGTMHLSAGQEAVAVGAGFVTRDDDYLLNHHRGHGHFIASGADSERTRSRNCGDGCFYCGVNVVVCRSETGNSDHFRNYCCFDCDWRVVWPSRLSTCQNSHVFES